jgi:HAD superfamily hydrolase (TIGR01509 family)
MANGTALLFDLDGTLTDTDHLHVEAFRILLQDFGRTITLEHYRARIMGHPNDEIMREMFPDETPERRITLSDRKEQLFRDQLETLTPTAGVLQVLDWADAHGVPYAVVTNAPRANAEMMLHGLGLDRRMTELVIGDELERAKPDPLPYRTGLQRLGATAARALAFEDSLPGIRAAHGAGIATYGIRTAHPDAALLGSGAVAAITDFTDAGLWQRLEALL